MPNVSTYFLTTLHVVQLEYDSIWERNAARGQEKTLGASDIKFVEVVDDVRHLKPRLPVLVHLVKEIVPISTILVTVQRFLLQRVLISLRNF